MRDIAFFSICTKLWKFCVYFLLTAYLRSDTKFSSEIFKSYIDILKFTVEKVD